MSVTTRSAATTSPCGQRATISYVPGTAERGQHLLEGALGELQGVVEQEGGVPGEFALLVGL
ncbi:hypothetical protein ACWEP3_32870, partial [Streptomyces albidoflavus]